MDSKTQYLQMRAGKEDKELAKELANLYGLSVSELLRFALIYLDEHRPSLTITIAPGGKVIAPEGAIA